MINVPPGMCILLQVGGGKKLAWMSAATYTHIHGEKWSRTIGKNHVEKCHHGRHIPDFLPFIGFSCRMLLRRAFLKMQILFVSVSGGGPTGKRHRATCGTLHIANAGRERAKECKRNRDLHLSGATSAVPRRRPYRAPNLC